MDRKYCYLVNISHPDGCSDDYVILNIDDLPLCLKDFQFDYSVNDFSDSIEILIKRVILKGGSSNGESKKDAKS